MDGVDSGTRQELTVESAGEKLAGLLSQSRSNAPPESQSPAKEAPAPSDTEHESEGAKSEEEAPEGASAEADEQQTEQPERRPVIVNGVEVEQVTFEDAVKGYMRTKDYTQKTQAASEARKRAESEETALREKHQMLADSLKQLEQAINEQEPKEPEWESLKSEDPENYRDIRDSWELYKERKAEIVKQREIAERQVADDNAKAFQLYREAEDAALLDAIPEWKDAEKLKAEATKVAQHATTALGFTHDEIKGVIDHRIVLALRKAMLYDEAQKAKPEIKNKMEKSISAAKPGAPSKKPSALVESRKRLATSGKIDDAADLLTRALQAQKASAKR